MDCKFGHRDGKELLEVMQERGQGGSHAYPFSLVPGAFRFLISNSLLQDAPSQQHALAQPACGYTGAGQGHQSSRGATSEGNFIAQATFLTRLLLNPFCVHVISTIMPNSNL